ncbi:putative sugar epimerase YhfK [Marinomonas aquimarina]|uniref:Putative sugar epimerase YhfK n=1 Tax=Marinomonas aquimarina TaxID=295068 RepID=A0A1A8TI99_9GAMM|nr:SDR family oxidoreductase [Marinomonas aquimarina]SBS32483.1 putative sugar epimerase YhfK [Marinomonas aquimarina]
MSTILVIGATGQIGQKVCRTLLSQGYTVRAFVRDSQRASELSHAQLQVFQGNLEEDFSAAYEGVNKVVFVAGSGSGTGCDKTLLIDLWAAKRAIDYAEEEPTVSHFIMLSAFGADDPDEHNTAIKPYLVAKHIVDEYLTLSSLPYTILRPGKLTNEAPRHGFTAERPLHNAGTSITRADVAEAICYCVTHDTSKIKVVELFQGQEPLESLIN